MRASARSHRAWRPAPQGFDADCGTSTQGFDADCGTCTQGVDAGLRRRTSTHPDFVICRRHEGDNHARNAWLCAIARGFLQREREGGAGEDKNTKCQESVRMKGLPLLRRGVQ